MELSNKYPKENDLLWKVQTPDGKWIESTKPPYKTDMNQKNYEIAGIQIKGVEDVKEKSKVITYETDKMINLAALIEKEPDLFEDLAKDYPCEEATYVFEVKKAN